MPRPTLTDIAKEAGVSLATVDRAMNGRGSVRARTLAHIKATANRLGYLDQDGRPVLAEPPLVPVQIVFVLPQGTNAFIHELERQVAIQTPQFVALETRVTTIAGFDPLSLAKCLDDLRGKTQGVALVALDHPVVREAVRRLIRSGTSVVTLASDILNVPHLGYIGINDAQAGRMAGYLLGRLIGPRPAAEVAFFAGSLAYRGHQEREIGFRQVLHEDFPNIEIVQFSEVHENRDKARSEMARLLRQHPDLAGVYNAGGATAGIAGALTELGRHTDCVFIAHDTTDGNKALLLDGTLDAVIDQNARVEIREALNTLVHAARGQDYEMVPPRLQVVFRENLPVE